MDQECGVSKVMDIFGGKWKLKILWIICNHEGFVLINCEERLTELLM